MSKEHEMEPMLEAKGTIVSREEIWKTTGTPFCSSKRPSKEARARIGVPGHKKYKYDGNFFTGAVPSITLDVVLKSPFFWCHLAILILVAIIFGLVDNNAYSQMARMPEYVNSVLLALCVFALTFYVAQVYSKWFARFDHNTRTHSNIARLGGLAAGTLEKVHARNVLRYANAIVHLYYYLNSSGGLAEYRWKALENWGILTLEEIALLQKHGQAAPVVLYSWAIKTVQKGSHRHDVLNIALEECIAAARASAKQIFYTEAQIPHIYYASIAFLVNALLFCLTFDSFGQYWLQNVNSSCESIMRGDDLSSDGPCIPGMIFGLIGQLTLLLVFSSLYTAGLALSEWTGGESFHYDLGFHLDANWKTTLEVLESMDQEPPDLPNKSSS